MDMVSVEFDSEVNAMYIHLKSIEILLPKHDIRVSEFVSKL